MIHEKVMWHVKGRNAVEIRVPMIQEEGAKSGKKTGKMEAGN